MITIDCEQNTPEWAAIRTKLPTASNFHKIITTKGKPSEQKEKYMYQLAGESITGVPEPTYQSLSMLRGIEMEDEAREYYSFLTGQEVQRVGFCLQDKNGVKYGCSPDGLIGDDGIVEIKCPSLAVHVEYLLGNKLPTAYFQQVHGEILCTERKWNDFFSYYPGMKPFLLRVYPDQPFLQALSVELEIFSKDLKEIIERIR